jgi:hypothetical protein
MPSFKDSPIPIASRTALRARIQASGPGLRAMPLCGDGRSGGRGREEVEEVREVREVKEVREVREAKEVREVKEMREGKK